VGRSDGFKVGGVEGWLDGSKDGDCEGSSDVIGTSDGISVGSPTDGFASPDAINVDEVVDGAEGLGVS
jgi:hypothetical protein